MRLDGYRIGCQDERGETVMRLFIVSMFALIAFATSALAVGDSEGESKLTKVADYLNEHVAGKALETKITQKIDNGWMEAVFARRMTFSKILVSRNLLAFDVVAVINQTNYDLDKDVQRVMPGHKEDRVLVVRYEIWSSKSTGAMTGISRCVSSSMDEAIGGANSVRLSLKDNTLTLDEVTVGYADLFASGGKSKPGGEETRRVISVVDGKVRMTDDTTAYDIDSDTLKRSNPMPHGAMISEETD